MAINQILSDYQLLLLFPPNLIQPLSERNESDLICSETLAVRLTMNTLEVVRVFIVRRYQWAMFNKFTISVRVISHTIKRVLRIFIDLQRLRTQFADSAKL
ncbi:hypothetical protein J6590_020190 [Homalodisca vitripennis]|nr:hypothetical protein J6590_020190 [Homalodisca vitripennis]